jgi:hypothetical protein
MDGHTTFLWMVLWRLGNGSWTPTEDVEAVVDTIDVPETATAAFERLMIEKAMPQAARGVTRRGSVVERQFLFESSRRESGQNSGMHLIDSDVKRALEEMRVSTATVRYAMLQTVERAEVARGDSKQ